MTVLDLHMPEPFRGLGAVPVLGGMVAQAARIELRPGEPAFLKWREDADAGTFAAEAAGLEALRAAAPGAAPRVLDVDDSWLLLEWIERSPAPPGDAEERRLAELLAGVHARSSDDARFGYPHRTWIGRLPQDNAWCGDWTDFYLQRRIRPQLDLALASGALDAGQAVRIEAAARIVAEATPSEPPVLVHGDLWSGNWMVATDGRIVLFDPAVSRSHRELELAFIGMFGGVGSVFWQRYEDLAPTAPGRAERAPGYELYHLVVHVNHFGSGYLPRTLDAVARVLD